MESYWARAEVRARASVDRLDPASWFDYWHTHIDWCGRGSSKPENRSMVNAAAIRVLLHLEERLSGRDAPAQTWADLYAETVDTGIYAHSANPNGSPFPCAFGHVNWEAPVPPDIQALVPSSHIVGTASHEGRVWHIVQRGPNHSSKPTPLRGTA